MFTSHSFFLVSTEVGGTHLDASRANGPPSSSACGLVVLHPPTVVIITVAAPKKLC